MSDNREVFSLFFPRNDESIDRSKTKENKQKRLFFSPPLGHQGETPKEKPERRSEVFMILEVLFSFMFVLVLFSVSCFPFGGRESARAVSVERERESFF